VTDLSAFSSRLGLDKISGAKKVDIFQGRFAITRVEKRNRKVWKRGKM
jgi:hypothetical protein